MKKIYGHVNNIKEGATFISRKEVKIAGLHIHTEAGIDGTEKEAACAIVLSKGYEDDVDELDVIHYTGQGGQDKSRKKQIKHQEFTKGNRGLVLSKEYNLPVRVIRGYQTLHGPKKGYRYDGLYYVKNFKRVLGKSGFYVCKFYLESEHSIESLEEKIQHNLKPDYKRTKRKTGLINKLQRNTTISEKLKEIYEHRCQICNTFLSKKNSHTGICIGAHIKGLGRPDNGPDDIANMLCLCPNHHAQFDDRVFYIDPDNLKIIGLSEYEGKKLITSKKHKIDPQFLQHQKHLCLEEES